MGICVITWWQKRSDIGGGVGISSGISSSSD